jgi:hypothetical protein
MAHSSDAVGQLRDAQSAVRENLAAGVDADEARDHDIDAGPPMVKAPGRVVRATTLPLEPMSDVTRSRGSLSFGRKVPRLLRLSHDCAERVDDGNAAGWSNPAAPE